MLPRLHEFLLSHSDEKGKKVQVAPALSDLIVYTDSVKFFSFSRSKDNQTYCEKKARKVVKVSGRAHSKQTSIISQDELQ